MTKGKFGIYLWFYAALAFVLVALNQTLLCALLLGFVIIAENDEWLTKQVIQAFSLSLTGTVITAVFTWIYGTLSKLLSRLFNVIPVIEDIFSGLFSFLTGLISILVLVLAIVAIIKIMKGNSADLPCLKILSDKAFEAVGKKED